MERIKRNRFFIGINIILLVFTLYETVVQDEVGEVDPLSDLLGFDSTHSESLHKSRSSHSYSVKRNKLLSILVNRVYKGEKKFLRELISNARDALNKMRLIMINTEESEYTLDDINDLEIRISIDKEKGLLFIKDNGIGMTEKELHDNLGNIANSGTEEFFKKWNKGSSKGKGKGKSITENLIGQFGVGFYSAFMPAETVVVVTKSFKEDSKQMIWRSNPSLKDSFGSSESKSKSESESQDESDKEEKGEEEDPSYYVYEDPRGNTLGRGTEIILKLKKEEQAQQFLDMDFLEERLKKFTMFSGLRILVLKEKEREKEVEMSEEEIEEEKEKAAEKEQEKEEEEEKKWTKKIKEKYKEWTPIEISIPIWEVEKSSLSHKDYLSFYRKLVGSTYGPKPTFARHVHFNVEGQTFNFSVILFIPKSSFSSQNFSTSSDSRISIFLKNVIVTEKVPNLLPKQFNFVVGAVNASNLEVNVDRESFQGSKELNLIGKKLTRKVSEMLDDWLEEFVEKSSGSQGKEDVEKDELEFEGSESEGKGGEGKEREREKEKEEWGYKDFFETFGHYIKYGMIENVSEKNSLSKFLLFNTTWNYSVGKDGEEGEMKNGLKEYQSLEQYEKRMKENQKDIFYVSSDSLENALLTPSIERFLEHAVEVLVLTSPLDESALQHAQFKTHTFVDITKENANLSFLESVAEEEEKIKELEKNKTFGKLLKFFKEIDSSGRIFKTKLSSKLGAGTPLAVVASEFGMSANMQKVMKAHNLSGKHNAQSLFMQGFRVLEINPNSEVIRELNALVARNSKDAKVVKMGKVLLDSAFVVGGYDPMDKKGFSETFYGMVGKEISEIEVEELVEDVGKEDEGEGELKGEEDVEEEEEKGESDDSGKEEKKEEEL